MIPKILWQTYEIPENDLPSYAKECMQTWKDKNPNWSFRYMDARQREDFVLKEFGKEWHNVFINLPVNIMRADIWRYMVLYKYGGVYADLDIICHRPIDTWVKDEYDMIVSVEDEMYFAQWILASTKDSPIFKYVVDSIWEGLKKADYTEEHYVHKLTASAILTRSISKFLDIPIKTNILTEGDFFNNLPKSKKYKFHCYTGKDSMLLHKEAIEHLYGGLHWRDGQYQPWSDTIPYNIWNGVPWIEYED